MKEIKENPEEFKKIKESLTAARTDYFASVVVEAVNEGLIRWQDINNQSGQKFKAKKDFDSWLDEVDSINVSENDPK